MFLGRVSRALREKLNTERGTRLLEEEEEEEEDDDDDDDDDEAGGDGIASGKGGRKGKV